MHTLKRRYTIVIVTHNMQQAARVADRTAFFSLDATERARRRARRVRRHGDDLHAARRPADARLRRRAASAEPSREAPEPSAPARAAAGRTASSRRRRCSGARRRMRRRRRRRSPPCAGCARPRPARRRPPAARGALDEHVDADAVADRHLVDEAAEVPLELGHARGELVAAAAHEADRRRPAARRLVRRARARWRVAADSRRWHRRSRASAPRRSCR